MKLEGHMCAKRSVLKYRNSGEGAIAACKKNPNCVGVYDRRCNRHVGHQCLKLESGNEIIENSGVSCVYKKGN